ncbi:interferon-inducible double-stranded RNA-dependent protein kinase activator A homolog isoform X1 [Callorhinchus milii]|uniref:Protein kinase, interferon-inducible double stranded RNA dependent activator n=1 Tax=Callorhinchus milii TaxID=7868 RepID=V9KRF9_CALMI|nr:interferon-inducible double-stranded RNA-dependent protein kinase activator A homolog isoform X1 [Callorhinchus milii]
MSEERFTAASKRSSGYCSLDQMIAAIPGKTPISLLQEYCTRNGNSPQYELVTSEGQAHLPCFVYKVVVGEVSCTGEGPSKKAAKHKAAEAVLHVLNEGALQDLVYNCMSYPLPNSQPLICSTPPQNQTNHIGILQEMVVQKGWRIPEYTFTQESGPAHKKEFTIICRVESFVETGCGTSKKLAKRDAAEKMFAKLQNIPAGWMGGEELDTGGISMIPGNKWDSPQPKGIACTWDVLRNSPGEKINQLKRSPLSIPNSDYTQMLGEVVDEQRFDVTYLDIDELSVNGQYQCLAELSTQPVTVCHGTGISRGNAHNDAAHNALQYLKIMAGRN